jgi:hypothetical protein
LKATWGGGQLTSLLTTYNLVCFLLGNSPASEFCMPTYNLSHTVNFAELKILSTVIENIFVVYSRPNLSSISPIINGLSDHDAHILTIKNIYI